MLPGVSFLAVKIWRAFVIVLLIAGYSMLSLSASVSANTNKTLDYTDVFDVEYADNPVFHPSEDWLVYERVGMDRYKDQQTRNLWLHSTKNRHAPLIPNIDSSYSAVFSNNGDKIAFLSSTVKGTQIFVYHIDTRDLIQVTNVEKPPSNIAWSPDDEQLAFTMFTQSPATVLFDDLPKPPKGAQWAPKATVIDSINYRRDGLGYLAKGTHQIYLVPAESGSAKQLTSGDYNHQGAIAWANKNTIYFTSYRQKDWMLSPLSQDIYALNIDTGDINQVTDLTGPESTISLSQNGKYLAFLHTNDRKLSYQVNQLMLMSLQDNSIKTLTPSLDRQIVDYQWQANGKDLVISYIDRGQTKLAKVTQNGKISELNANLGSQSLGRPYTSGDFAVSNENKIVYTQNNPQRPAELVMYQRNKPPKILTKLNNDIEHINFARTKAITIQSSFDKLNIDAWIAYPPNFNPQQKYPMILEIHGGPHAAYGNTFSLEVQLMAAKGYIVVWSNPRGSSSYGEDFGNTIHHNYPSEDYNDLMDVVDAVVKKGNVDTNNLFVTGGSGGGVLTAWIVGNTDRFNAAVVAKPVINWLSFALTADIYPYFTQYWMPQMPWEIPEHLWKHSPLSLISKVTTPTMLLTGEVDYRTPMSETEQYYQALQLAGVPTAMVRIPEASHGIAKRPTHLMQKIGNILAWFEKYRNGNN